MSLPLEPLFSPKSIAILGASATPGRPGYNFTVEMLRAGFAGEIFPVNPRGGEILGRRVYERVQDIPSEIDLAIILVNRSLATQAVKECAEHGIKVGVIYTAGFGELDEGGEQLQRNLVEIARAKGMRLVGPNCYGVFSAAARLNLTGEPGIPAGPIGLISQSGGIAVSNWFDAANYLKTGFSRFIGFGNQADIPIHEYIEYLRDDPETRVIVLYMEGILPGMGQAFLEVARQTTPLKPIVVIKGGRTLSGNRAAASHTGSLAGAAEVYSAAFRQAGIIEVDRLDELLPVAQALYLSPGFKGNKLALIGAGGGHMILSSDAAERNGFDIPPFSEETDARLKEHLYDFAPSGNPVDLAGSYAEDMDRWHKITRIALEEPGIGGVMVYGAYGTYYPDHCTDGETWETTSRRVAKLQQETGKPIVFYTVAARADLACNRALREGGIPLFDSIDIAARALRALREYQEFRERSVAGISHAAPLASVAEAASVTLSAAANRPHRNLTEHEAYSLLTEYDIPVARHHLAASEAEAVAAAESLGYPVVLKLCSPDVIHKSDLGVVKLGLRNAGEVRKAYQTILDNTSSKAPDAKIAGTIVASQVSGVEIIAGIFRDVQFGPVLMVGLGGIFVETLKDVAFRVLPASPADLRGMLKELQGYPLLTGARGTKPVNMEALISLLGHLGDLALAHPNIDEIDLNPIFVDAQVVTVSDARIILSPAVKGVEVLL